MSPLRQYLRLCWLKGDLVEMPESMPLFRNAIIFYFVVGILIQANISDPVEALFETSIQTVLNLVFIALLLCLKKSFKLYLKTATAFLVAADFIYVFGIPVMLWFTLVGDELVIYLFGLLLMWWLFIITYIIRHALSCSTLLSTMMALLYIMIVYVGTFALLVIV